MMARYLSAILCVLTLPALHAQSGAALRGAGATFPAPIYQKWIEAFEAKYPGLPITYQPTGSEEGMRRLGAGGVDFAAADVLPTREMQTKLGVALFPSVVGAVVPAYNIRGLARDLRFTPEVLADIFLGRITNWNDPKIQSLNRAVKLPSVAITVVHRSDGSGTTFVWSEFLSKTSAEWRAAVGEGSTLRWPVGQGAQGNGGVAALLTSTPFSIGYVEFIYALQNELSYGAVRNAAGRFIRPEIDSIGAAARTVDPAPDFRISITNAPGRDAYPIASFTWFLMPSRMPEQKRQRLVAFLDWALSAGQRQAAALGYVALPEDLAGRERAAVAHSNH
ncbi:MAG TPA: phosphate ABC transporter substrate-binding protein PstS [Bryobacteraceae bacterium]|nr:phosphate ABC transporter substrate-binding protein PstS [Bryobacteraceae bacterium]